MKHLSPQEILTKTVEAHGSETWQQPQTLMLKGVATWTPHGKTDAESIFLDTYEMYRVFPSENNAAHQANGKVRFDAKSGKNVFMHLIFDGKNTNNYLSQQAEPYRKHFAWSNNFGFSIIRFANQEGFLVERLADDQVEGFPCCVVKITDPKNMITTFLIDQNTFYIRSVAFSTEVGFHQRIYSNFKPHPTIPFIQSTRVRLYFDGIKWIDIDWQYFEVNNEIDDNIFRSPTTSL